MIVIVIPSGIIITIYGDTPSDWEPIAIRILKVASILWYWLFIAAIIKRLHDMNLPGLRILNPIIILLALFRTGTDGPNRYGEDPTLNPLADLLLGK